MSTHQPKHLPKNLNPHQQHILSHVQKKQHISRNINQDFDESLTFGQRIADKVASFGGSWTFILSFLFILVLWIILNSVLLARSGEAFDPYPYILLNLVLSMIASLQAPVIMMSQNRQAAKDRLDASHDYEVNLKAEWEIMALHEKMDALREQQWQELVAMQQEQIRLLTALLQQQTPPSGQQPPCE
ncbi:MAG: hypothetical protein RI964_2394 [Pseudomonadota bacterium]|jgi:uncharacterized membrane protein